MHLTSFGIASIGALPVLLFATACGQITGLSDDYQFDLDGSSGGTRQGDGGDASADGASADASGDAPVDSADGAAKCTAAQRESANQRLSAFGGITACKVCLAGSCCTQVDTCSRATDCARVLGCELECTAKLTVERQQCLKSCQNAGGGVPPLFANGVGACATTSCTQDCGF